VASRHWKPKALPLGWYVVALQAERERERSKRLRNASKSKSVGVRAGFGLTPRTIACLLIYTGIQMLEARQNLPSTAMLSKHEAVGEEGTCHTISSI
jgi:hypothetical protein